MVLIRMCRLALHVFICVLVRALFLLLRRFAEAVVFFGCLGGIRLLLIMHWSRIWGASSYHASALQASSASSDRPIVGVPDASMI